MNLLIADDEAVIRRGLLSLDWKSIGITDVYSVANGVEAKELLLSTSIDLVIFDIRMPGFSGLELAQMENGLSMWPLNSYLDFQNLNMQDRQCDMVYMNICLNRFLQMN